MGDLSNAKRRRCLACQDAICREPGALAPKCLFYAAASLHKMALKNLVTAHRDLILSLISVRANSGFMIAIEIYIASITESCLLDENLSVFLCGNVGLFGFNKHSCYVHHLIKTSLLSRADVKDTVKLILGVPFANSRLFNEHLTLETRTESQFCLSVGCDGFRKTVSGRIDSSVLSLFLLPSVCLSLLPVLACLPSFSCNKFVGRRT